MTAARAADPDRLVAPIIVLGAPRSGTTMLAELLGAHPDVALVGEPRLVWRYGNDRRSDELRPEHATADVVEHIHRSFAAVVREQGAARLVDKTPSNAVRPRFVEAVVPDARYVHITRNGWGAVPSMREFWGKRGTGMDKKQARKTVKRFREASPRQLPFYAREMAGRFIGGRLGRTPLYGPRLAGLQAIADELGRLEASALQWRTCVERSALFGRSLPPGRYLELKLEELTSAGIAAMLEFCDLRPADDVVEHFARTFRVELATGRAPLPADERARIEPYVVPANALLGYGAEVAAPT